MKDNSIIGKPTITMQSLWMIGLFLMLLAITNVTRITLFNEKGFSLLLHFAIPCLIALALFSITGIGHPKGILWSCNSSMIAAITLSSSLIGLVGLVLLVVSRFTDHIGWSALAIGTLTFWLGWKLSQKRGIVKSA